jgi:hypothetical protein
MVKSKRVRWMGLAGCMEVMRSAYRISFGKPEGKRPLINLSIDGMIIIKWHLEKHIGRCRLDLSGSI